MYLKFNAENKIFKKIVIVFKIEFLGIYDASQNEPDITSMFILRRPYNNVTFKEKHSEIPFK